MTELVLIRHGRTEANDRWLYCGRTDLPLTDKGCAEIRTYLRRGVYPDLTGWTVYTSGLRRTEQTLELICGVRPHFTDRRLREMDFGDFEMRSYEELKNDPAYQTWITGDNMANVCPNGESGNQVTARVLEALEDLRARYDKAALFTHGGVIAVIMEALFPGAGKTRYDWQPKNGLGYRIAFSGQNASFRLLDTEGSPCV